MWGFVPNIHLTLMVNAGQWSNKMTKALLAVKTLKTLDISFEETYAQDNLDFRFFREFLMSFGNQVYKLLARVYLWYGDSRFENSVVFHDLRRELKAKWGDMVDVSMRSTFLRPICNCADGMDYMVCFTLKKPHNDIKQ